MPEFEVMTCGEVLPHGEDECHCTGCHKTFPTDKAFFAHKNEDRCQVIVFRGGKTAGQGAWKPPPGYRGAQTAEIRKREAKKAAAPKKCRKGLHDWIPKNLYVSSQGVASCKPCRKEYAKERARKARQPLV